MEPRSKDRLLTRSVNGDFKTIPSLNRSLSRSDDTLPAVWSLSDALSGDYPLYHSKHLAEEQS